MLEQTIIHYLKSNKRLVVPQLGAFIVKVPGQTVVFSELLRTDDGVLRGLLCAQGINELEAAGLIDRFVFEVRHGVQNSDEYIVDGLGVLRGGPNATIIFTYDPGCHGPLVELRARKAAVEVQVLEPEPEKPREVPRPRPRPEVQATQPASEPRTSPAPMQPDPYIKGLRYGKPERTTNSYHYIDGAPRRKGFDKLVLVAVVASIIALATIAFVYIRDSRSDEQPAPVEQSADMPISDIEMPADGQTQTTQQ